MPTVELLREQQVGLLGVAIDLPPVIRRRVQKLLARRLRRQQAVACLGARHQHDARRAGLQQLRQSGDERNVTQVVGRHLALKALSREPPGPAHHAGVADQGRHVVIATEQRLGTARDLHEVGEIELDNARRAGPGEACRGRVALRRVAHRQHDVGAASDQVARRCEPDAAVGAGHHHSAPGLLGQQPRVPAHASSLRGRDDSHEACASPHPRRRR